jgi:hypothetical protein
MPSLTSLDQIFLVISFLVPGFVFSACKSLFINRMERQGAEIFIRYLSFSTLNMAAFSFLLYAQLSEPQRAASKSWMWFVIIFLSPVFCGLIVGYWQRHAFSTRIVNRSPLLSRLVRRIGFKITHPIGTAWDWRLGSIDECWVIVCLKDGTEWAGFFGEDSFAASETGQRDLYLQKVYTIDDDSKAWQPTHSSVWLAGGEITSIEFIPYAERGTDDK